MLYKTLCILLSGKIGSGKSALAGYLLEEFQSLGRNTTAISFATPIKMIARDFMGWDGEKDEKGRKLLQHLGTEVGRAYNENCWVDWMFNKFLPKQKYYPYDVIIVDDWRFPNEASYISSLGLYDVFRTRVIRNMPYFKCVETDHASENSLPEDMPDYYDLLYYNKDSIYSMRKDARNMARIILSLYDKE